MPKEIENELIWVDYQNSECLNLDFDHVFKFPLSVYTEIEMYYNKVLSIDELNKANRFKKPDDLKRYIIGKFFTRTLLAKELRTEASKVVFFETANKKPTVNNFNFNISHSGNFVLIALSNSPIGIDIEYINKSFDFKNLLNQCFNLSELFYIKNIANFYEFWTRKESIIKATGEGLIENLHDIDCSNDSVFRLNKKYHLKTAYIDDSHIFSLALSKQTKNTCYWNYKFQ